MTKRCDNPTCPGHHTRHPLDGWEQWHPAETVTIPRAVALELVRIADSWSDPLERSGLTKSKHLYEGDAVDLMTGVCSLAETVAAAIREERVP